VKILHISTYDRGGAAIAAIRLHEGLLNGGIASKILFLHNSKKNVDEGYSFKRKRPSFLSRKLGYLGLNDTTKKKLKREIQSKSANYDYVSIPYSSYDINTSDLVKDADIINLHWVSQFLDWRSFFYKNEKPIVWTMHDMNPILGVFHYEGDKEKNKTTLGKLDNKIIAEKTHILKSIGKKFEIVAPSKWLQREVEQSSIFSGWKVRHIPYGVNENLFKPFDKNILKELLGIPIDKRIVLFVSEDLKSRRKGMDLLLDALETIDKSKLHIIAVGGHTKTEKLNGIHYTGYIQNIEYMRLIYAVADVFVIPAREDNLPNTVLESMSCGTPVVGFGVGGIPDMIIHGETGLLAEPENSKDLGQKIYQLINEKELGVKMGQQARQLVLQRYTLDKQAQNYIDFYQYMI